MSKLWQHMNSGKPQCLYSHAIYRDELDESQRAKALERHQSEQSLIKGTHRLSRPRDPAPVRLIGPIMPLPPKQVALQFVQDSVPTVDPLPRVYEPVPLNLLNHKYYFVLHSFSGQRRCDDIQDALDKLLCKEGQPLPVTVLSVDRINGILGDLTNPDTILFWLRTVRERKTLAILGGPPCETWTAAKFMELFH